jgi:plastocyanin
VSTVLHVLSATGPSKVPFYAAGAALAAWALVLSALGLRRPGFPGGRGGAAGVIGITGLLMAATLASGIATATKPVHAGREGLTEGPGEAHTPQEGQRGGTPGGRPAQPSETGQAPAGTLRVSADPSGQLRYEQRSLSVGAGRVNVAFTNRSPVSHDVKVERDGRTIGGTRVVSNGQASATVELEPGEYTFYCSVDAHRQAGMEGPLRVR